jgi:hypothetical protein
LTKTSLENVAAAAIIIHSGLLTTHAACPQIANPSPVSCLHKTPLDPHRERVKCRGDAAQRYENRNANVKAAESSKERMMPSSSSSERGFTKGERKGQIEALIARGLS